MTTRPYERLGALLTKLAKKRRANGPTVIARRIEEVTGLKVTHQAISRYLRGTRCPGPEFMHAFAEAFALTTQERRQLAWMYTFSDLPN
jgi:transcriptional regulator with XRE-family HTH domain